MAKWTVTKPLTGSLVFYGIEAETEAEAIEACDQVEWQLDLKNNSNGTVDLGEEFSLHNIVTKGNVCYAALNEAEAIEDEDDNEDD